MTPEEEAEFQQSVERVNAGIWNKQRQPKNLLDGEANPCFRYSIENHAQAESHQ